MKTRFAVLLLLSASVLAAPALLRAPPSIGAVVQAWHYDRQTKIVTVSIANISGKDITAYNMSITETFADHSVSKHEVLNDMLGAVILVQQVKGTPDEDRILREFGNGTLAAYQTRDRVFGPYNKVIEDFQGIIDVVAYADGSAEATNTSALERMRDHRNAEIRSHQKANQVVKEVLADPTIQAPIEEAIKRLENVLSVYQAVGHTTVEIEPSLIEAVANDLRIAAARHPGDETKVLQRYAAEKDQRISMLLKHGQLKTGAAQ